MKKNIPKSSRSRIEGLLGVFSREAYPWRILRIIREFRAGFRFLRRYERAVSIFGSARHNFDEELYQDARNLAFRLSKYGFAVITGGGPGFMEAANHGAQDAGGRSVGLNIELASEQRNNPYVDESISFRYFFTRKVMLAFASQIYIFYPGGFGTLDEFFEIITLIQTRKMDSVPVILVNREYWQPLLTYIEEVLYEKNRAIDREDMKLYHLVDNADEAFDLIHGIIEGGNATNTSS